MVCPNCKSSNLTRNSTFETMTEPIGEMVSSRVVIDMVCCELCHIEYPAIRGRQKYTLVSKRRLQNMVQEQTDLIKQNFEFSERLGAIEKRRVEISDEIRRFKARCEIESLGSRIGFLELGIGGLQARRDRIKEVADAMVAQGVRASPATPLLE